MFDDLCDVTLSVNFARSQGEEEVWSPDCLPAQAQKYRCFKCYGQEIEHCSECHGFQTISLSHPLAQLLNAVLLRKLNCKTDDILIPLDSVRTIKEEEEDTQEKRACCSNCRADCECPAFSCQQCTWSVLCPRCQHLCSHHPVIVANEKGKRCHGCRAAIENCYSVCRTCESNSCQFWVCGECSDRHNYFHPSSHLFETVIDYAQHSVPFSHFDEEEIDIISLESLPLEHNQNTLEAAQLALETAQLARKATHLSQPKRMRRENSSIVQHSDDEDPESPVLRSQPSKEQTFRPGSKVHFQVDGLFSSHDIIRSSMGLKGGRGRGVKEGNMLCPPTVRHQCFSQSLSWMSKSKEEDKENESEQQEAPEYLFHGYKCDVCDIQPIRNVKYHCNYCEDYDVCQDCYEEIKQHHQHSSFDKVDGRGLKEKALQRASHQQNVLRTSLAHNFCPSRGKVRRTNTIFA